MTARTIEELLRLHPDFDEMIVTVRRVSPSSAICTVTLEADRDGRSEHLDSCTQVDFANPSEAVHGFYIEYNTALRPR